MVMWQGSARGFSYQLACRVNFTGAPAEGEQCFYGLAG